MAETTRADLVERVAGRLGGYRQLTATGGSTTTVVDTANLTAPDDYYEAWQAYVLTDAGGASAAPEGETRPVTEYSQATATLTVSPAFTAAVAAGDTVELLPVERGVICDAINAAIRAAGLTWPVVVVDATTLDVTADDYDYDLPAAVATLLSVSVRTASDDPWVPVPGAFWWVSGTPGALELMFTDRLGRLGDGDDMRLEYLKAPAEMTADDSALGVGEPAESELAQYVEDMATAWLYERGAGRNLGDFRERITMAQTYRKRADELKEAASVYAAGPVVIGARWPRAKG